MCKEINTVHSATKKAPASFSPWAGVEENPDSGPKNLGSMIIPPQGLSLGGRVPACAHLSLAPGMIRALAPARSPPAAAARAPLDAKFLVDSRKMCSAASPDGSAYCQHTLGIQERHARTRALSKLSKRHLGRRSVK
jgi:hypothetical protein